MLSNIILFIYYPSIYSSPAIKENTKVTNDVFFVGRAKDRLAELHNAYKCLNSKGFRCDFYITGVAKEDCAYPEDIHYNTHLTYSETLAHVMKSKGILEIVQKGANAFTFRLDEALIYDKNIITNNAIIDDLPKEWGEKIFRYDMLNEIHKDNYDRAYLKTYGYDERYSSHAFLEYLDDLFG